MEPTTRAENGFIEELCRAYEAPLHRYLTQMVGSQEIAHALAQHSFAHMRRTYRPGQVTFPRAILFRAATNFALMYLRRRVIDRGVFEGAIEMDSAAEGAADHGAPAIDRQVLAEQIGQHLVAAIKELRPTLQKVFVMAHVQRKSRREIATTLGVSEKRVDKRMTTALKACRERLAARGIDLAQLD